MTSRTHIRILLTLVLLLPLFSSAASASDIQWKLFLKPYQSSGAILEKTTGEGQEFVIRESDCKKIPAESGEIVSAFDGVSFLLDQSPVRGALTIHIILNVKGNAFESVGGITLFLNMSFEAYVNGERADYIDFSRSPMIMTIPQSGLSSLLSSSNLTRKNIMCVFRDGGVFTDEGIESNDITTRMVVRIYKLSQTVGGIGEDLGIEARVKYDTWSKIKLLFK